MEISASEEFINIGEENLNSILKVINELTACSIMDISLRVQLSIPTVKKLIDCAVEQKLVNEAYIAPSTGGRKAQLYCINKSYCFFLYIAIDNNVVYYIVKNYLGEICKSNNKEFLINDYLNTVDNIINLAIKEFSNIKIISLAIPALVHNGIILDWYYNKHLVNFDFLGYLKKKYKKEIIIENDMKAVAISSKCKNLLTNDLATIQFGHNGIGLGLICNGTVVRGANGFAGEIGFLNNYIKFFTNKSLAKIINEVIIYTNPQLIVIYSNENVDTEKIFKKAIKNLPLSVVPVLKLEKDYINDIFIGLEYLTEENKRIVIKGESKVL